MLAIRSSEFFVFDGKKSTEYGILNVTMQSGMFEEPFLAERSIKETKIRGNPKPYLQEIDENPLVFDLSFAFQDTWDQDKIREVARWLKQSYYKPLQFSNDDRVFYCVVVNSPQLIHNGLCQGYLTLTMRCNAPWAFSPVYTKDFDLSANTPDGTTIQFVNAGDESIKPEIWLQKVGNDTVDISIVNYSNAGLEMKFISGAKATASLMCFGNVADGETVTIGSRVYEFDTNNAFTAGRVQVNMGVDLTPANAVTKLTAVINNDPLSMVTAIADTSVNIITITYKTTGYNGNISVSDNCVGVAWDNATLTGGKDGLAKGETVYVNCEREEIISDIPDTPRFDDMQGDFLECVYGVNNLLVKGNVQIKFRYQCKLLQS